MIYIYIYIYIHTYQLLYIYIIYTIHIACIYIYTHHTPTLSHSSCDFPSRSPGPLGAPGALRAAVDPAVDLPLVLQTWRCGENAGGFHGKS